MKMLSFPELKHLKANKFGKHGLYTRQTVRKLIQKKYQFPCLPVKVTDLYPVFFLIPLPYLQACKCIYNIYLYAEENIAKKFDV